MKESVERLYFIDDTIKRAAFDKYDSIFQTFKQFIVHVKFKEWKDENKVIKIIFLLIFFESALKCTVFKD